MIEFWNTYIAPYMPIVLSIIGFLLFGFIVTVGIDPEEGDGFCDL